MISLVFEEVASSEEEFKLLSWMGCLANALRAFREHSEYVVSLVSLNENERVELSCTDGVLLELSLRELLSLLNVELNSESVV